MPKKKKESRYPSPTKDDVKTVNALIKKYGSQAAVSESIGISSYILTKIKRKEPVRQSTLDLLRKKLLKKKKGPRTPLQEKLAKLKQQPSAPRTFADLMNGDHDGRKRIEEKLDRVINFFSL